MDDTDSSEREHPRRSRMFGFFCGRAFKIFAAGVLLAACLVLYSTTRTDDVACRCPEVGQAGEPLQPSSAACGACPPPSEDVAHRNWVRSVPPWLDEGLRKALEDLASGKDEHDALEVTQRNRVLADVLEELKLLKSSPPPPSALDMLERAARASGTLISASAVEVWTMWPVSAAHKLWEWSGEKLEDGKAWSKTTAVAMLTSKVPCIAAFLGIEEEKPPPPPKGWWGRMVDWARDAVTIKPEDLPPEDSIEYQLLYGAWD